MKNGLERFEFYLAKLEDLLIQASKEKNPSLWLYSNDARTILFMLEGLAKLYAGLHNTKRFTKIKDSFKLLEDTLGAIDYYDNFAKAFVTDPSIPSMATDYIQGQAREKIQQLNELLVEKKWIGEKANKLKKIRQKLSGADWMKDKEEIKAIATFYRKAIEDINKIVNRSNCRFTEIETQVHELRRKLRWLSIYPRALQGAIQLTDNQKTGEYLRKYLTTEIINSPFNKMPEAGNNAYFLLLEKNYFYALSWMIASLGRVKDNGLKIIVITEALQQVKGVNHETAVGETYEILGAGQPKLSTILSEASKLCELYFKEKTLDTLVSGIGSIR